MHFIDTVSIKTQLICVFSKESAIGWGRLFETAQHGSDTLQQVVLIIEEGQACDRIKSGSQLNSQLCAGTVDSQTHQDTCQGDRLMIIYQGFYRGSTINSEAIFFYIIVVDR